MYRSSVREWLVALVTVLAACAALAQSPHQTHDTEHLRIMWRDGDASPEAVAMAAEDQAGALEAYPRHLGASFDELVAVWEAAIQKAFGELDGAEDLARRYREETPIQYNPVCREGEDF